MKTFELRRSTLLTVFAAAVISLGTACQPASETPNKPAATPVPTAVPSISPAPSTPVAGTEKLIGRWNGPEGTYLSITEKAVAGAAKDAPKKFSIEVKNLDKAETFEGTAKGDVIEFTRKGKVETVKSSTGAETGMKGFEKETTCVVVTKGSEGYCRKQ